MSKIDLRMRCNLVDQCLPQGDLKTRITALHADMLREVGRLEREVKLATRTATIFLIIIIGLIYGLAGHDEIAARNVPTYKETRMKQAQEKEEAAALALFEIPLKRKDLK